MPLPALSLITIALVAITLGAWQQPAASGGTGSWGYVLDETRAPQQANFCDTHEAALEVAGVFERFGARTGFSALANAPNCSLRVHGLTPRKLLRQIRIELESSDSYVVNFIQVELDDGRTPVLVTTRALTGVSPR